MNGFLLLLLLLPLTATSAIDSIYGEDNRQDIYAVSNPLIKTIAASTAAMMDKSALDLSGDEVAIGGKSYGEMYQLCPDQRFRFQPIKAQCSGTLIAPDVIMTAGHCYQFPLGDCRNMVWVFDYKVEKENQGQVRVPRRNVYECAEILLRVDEYNANLDFALIRLKTPVTDRSPVILAQRDVVKNDPLVLIGHPNGLPTKVAEGGTALRVRKTSFTTNLDAFTVNSGSGVFNPATGEVVGILTSGALDFKSQNGCSTAAVYQDSEAKEEVQRLEPIVKFMKLRKRFPKLFVKKDWNP
jgi:V8-like Glu-specific endopeptidase